MFCNLHFFNFTSITDVERVHHKQEYDRLEDGLQSVPKHENCHEKLRAEEDEEVCRCDLENEEPEGEHNKTNDHVGHLVELVHCGFRVVQSQGKSFALSECVYLQNPQNSFNHVRGKNGNLTGNELLCVKIITTQFLSDLLLTLLCSCVPSKRPMAFKASSCVMKRIKSDKYMCLHAETFQN
jgi:hypothetical protein